jgi:hypothetical protein
MFAIEACETTIPQMKSTSMQKKYIGMIGNVQSYYHGNHRFGRNPKNNNNNIVQRLLAKGIN